METCQSGRMCPLAKGVGRKASRVRIPPSPQQSTRMTGRTFESNVVFERQRDSNGRAKFLVENFASRCPELSFSTAKERLAGEFSVSAKLERWMSGLNQQFTKLSTPYRVHGFESHSLRNNPQGSQCDFWAEYRSLCK